MNVTSSTSMIFVPSRLKKVMIVLGVTASHMSGNTSIRILLYGETLSRK